MDVDGTKYDSAQAVEEGMLRMGSIIFVEYRIEPEKRELYFTHINKLLQYKTDVTLYEGTDQPNVFVEQWHDTTPQQYADMKRVRLQEQSEWDVVTACIPGGTAKLHIWEFAARQDTL
ncbi:hypothetical protein [Paenibacillus sp. UMB4589-SE434]|uniref:hypothetical protein n=1 Tax=Paenibacillus sp. UMB4589-SE434 TaxID=3046314 RepID=UPI00254BE8BB|nr:hypothetical protein [Paenibacillus sp. UMB4589-SE434]